MIPAASAGLSVANGGQTLATSGTAKPETTVTGQAKSSAGVTSPANSQPLTSDAVDPSRQAAVAPRLRDQETAERSGRQETPTTDAPTGPPPAFEETPLQRASRVIFDPPEGYLEVNAASPREEPPEETDPVDDTPNLESSTTDGPSGEPAATYANGDSRSDTATRQAEAAFEAARDIAKGSSAEVDVAV